MKHYLIRTISNFGRKYIKYVKKDDLLGEKIDAVVHQLAKDPFHKGLRTHRVSTKIFGKRYSSFVTGDIRIIWDFADDGTIILLLTIGGHEGKNSVYK